MSPPATATEITFQFTSINDSSGQSLNSFVSLGFSAGSTEDGGFNCSKPGGEKSNVSNRSRPRLMKMRRKQKVESRGEEPGKIHPTENEIKDADDDIKLYSEVRSVPSIIFDGGVRLEGGAKRGDSVGSVEQLYSGSDGLCSELSFNDSLLSTGFGNEHFLFGSSMNCATNSSDSKTGDSSSSLNKDSSNYDAQKEIGSFGFGASNTGPAMNRGSVSCPIKSGMPMERNLNVRDFDKRESCFDSGFSGKESSENQRQVRVDEFEKSGNYSSVTVFGSDKYGSTSSGDLDQQDSSRSFSHLDVNERGGVHCVSSTFGARGNEETSMRNSSKDIGETESVKDSSKPMPDMRHKDLSNSDDRNHANFVFGSNGTNSKLGPPVENISTSKGDMFNFSNRGKEDLKTGIKLQNAGCDGVFVFGGAKGKQGHNSGGSTGLMNESDRSNGDGSALHSQTSGSIIDSDLQTSSNSCCTSEDGSFICLINEMNRLNIGDSEVHANGRECCSSSFSVTNSKVFVFGSNKKNPGSKKLREKTEDMSQLPNHNYESNVSSSSFFSFAGTGIPPNGGLFEAPSVHEDEKDCMKLNEVGLDSSDAGNCTNYLKFGFTHNLLFSGIDKDLDFANSNRSLGAKIMKKRNGKLRIRRQQLFGQNRESEEGSSNQNHKSSCDSPVDFSPFQDTLASTSLNADMNAGGIVESSLNRREPLEHSEESGNDNKTANTSPSLSNQDGLSALRRQYKKKYKKVVSTDKVRVNNSDKENQKDPVMDETQVLEHWRMRGNQAYHAGKLSKAEEFYSMGINAVSHASTTGCSLVQLLLCYSNRAATRMSLRRMREAIEDCKIAAALDSNFLKVILRAANCYLLLGEVEDAIQCYNKCLSPGTDVCLDRRVTIEAADGMQKAKKVLENSYQSAKLLEEGTENAASSALMSITESLSISCFSERLLEMKAEALCMLRQHDEVIQLCQQTLDVAKMNFGCVDHLECSHLDFWRWNMQIRSHYRLGRFDLALDLIEKQEKMPTRPLKPGAATQESFVALAATIHELLCLKRSGNEAFKGGRYTEAIENYTIAISKGCESRPFMAICFCNCAAAHQSINQVADAISDCSLAIALDENYQKAISRRATLHEMIRDYKQAISDLQRLISLLESESENKIPKQLASPDGSNGGGKRDVLKARRRLSSIQEKARKEIPPDAYLILGIKSSDSEADIKKAYRKAALKHHPDKAGQVLARNDTGDAGKLWKQVSETIHNDADRLFKLIGEAYAVLSDPSKRTEYEEVEMRNSYQDSCRNSTSARSSTYCSSPPSGRGSWSGRQGGFSTSSEKNRTRRYWYNDNSNRWA